VQIYNELMDPLHFLAAQILKTGSITLSTSLIFAALVK